MTASEAKDEAVSWWKGLSAFMQGAILVASFVAAVILPTIGAAVWVAGALRSEQAWRDGLDDRLDQLTNEAALTRALTARIDLLEREREAWGDRLDALGGEMEGIQTALRDVMRPTMIFQLAPLAEPVRCKSEGRCDLHLMIRRTVRGADCKLVPELTLFRVHTPDLLQSVEVARMPPTVPDRNFGTGWATIDVSILAPPGFEGDVVFTMERFYDRCLGENDDIVVPQTSDPVRMIIEPA